MLSHTLKSLAIDDAMYASESYWELCVRYIRSSLWQAYFSIQYKTCKKENVQVCTFISYMQKFEQKRMLDVS
jgi:hypothetical protein